MQRNEYLAEVRRIQAGASGQAGVVARKIVLRPWRLGKTATELADVYVASVVAIRKLPPPPEDATDLEQHFLGPLEAQTSAVRTWAQMVRSDFRRFRVRKAMRELKGLGILAGQSNPEDLAWCRNYGIGA